MYPWYSGSRDSVGQFCGGAGPMPAIKTENGYNDCMLALDYASQSKKSAAAFVWSSEHASHHGQNSSSVSGAGNKCNSAQTVSNSSSSSGGGGGGSSGGGGGGAGGSSSVGGGVGPGGQPQGLVHHWMSVMAEHMNNAASTPHHHDPVHYMWNGVDQCTGSHAVKDNEYNWSRQSIMKQGYEAKINHSSEQHNQKGNGGGGSGGGGSGGGGGGGMDDNPMSAGSVATPSPLYNGGGSVQAPRSLSSGGSSSTSPPIGTPASGSHMLIVPHPINATKITDAHHVVTQNTSGRKYQCKMCPSIFSSKSELQLHSQLHMREVKPYKCSQCSKTFANSSYLSQHTRIHLGIKPYRCEICQRKFTQLSHLQQHIRTHTGDKPYKCRHPGCTKAFSQLSNLQSHSRCHQTDKPYKCNSCYKCFSDEPSLLEHIPKHKESKHLKTHICQYCGKSYTQETYLTKHMQKHAERLEKRPPIALGMATARGLAMDGGGGGGVGPPYWATGKMSPDSAANHLAEVLNQQEAVACLQGGGGGGGGGGGNGHGANDGVLSSEHAAAAALHREMNGAAAAVAADDYVLRLSQHAHAAAAVAAASASTPLSASSPLHPHEPIITVSTPGGGSIKTPSSSASAFTPIQSMGIGPHHHHSHHLNHHQHHHIADRAAYLPYPFSSGKMATAGSQLSGLVNMPNSMDMSTKNSHAVPSNHLHNQLISLQQIRSYHHQSPLTDHFIQGIKDKKDSIL